VLGPPEPAAAELVTAARPQLNEAQRERLSAGACSYGHAQRAHFAVDHDPSHVLGERNVFRYRPLPGMLVRAAAGADVVDVLLASAAALTAGTRFELSLAPELAAAQPFLTQLAALTVRVEPAASCAARVAEFARVRALHGVEPEVLTAAEAALIHVASEPVLSTGRIELLRYCREQSVSHRYHRYGNLAGARLLPPLRAAREHGSAS
jgi:RHH-type proline utilization regulon transcriptional repressor/proline dehydrogenase/delta 1-pyrroline-5-carboxylate dehydrogenase